MNVQQNFHMPLLCTGEDNASISDKNECCQEELGLQSVSGNSKSVRILEEFRRIYLDRLRQIEEETPEEGAELKLKTLTSWVNDLGEQNLMLVETVEQLEREAADRVTLLEERLKKSSHIALEYMSKLEEYDNQFLNQSVEKVHPVVLPIKTSSRLIQAQQTEEILKTRIGNLQNDISGLLELIRRARYDGSWDTNGLSFLEVTYEDIFGLYPHQVTDSVETTDHLQTTISMLQQKLGRALEDNLSKDQEIKLLQENIACQRADIKNLVEKIEELQSSSCGNTKELTNLDQQMKTSTFSREMEHNNAQLQRLIEENEQLIKENKFLSITVKNKSDKITALTQHLSEVDKNLKWMKESMAAEINEKREQLVVLRHDMRRLEKHIIQADKEAQFKNAIIKEMRKDIKDARTKLASQKSSQTASKHVDENKCKKKSNETSNILVRCVCLPNRLHFHHSDRTCNEPVICCSDLIKSHLQSSFTVGKRMDKIDSVSHHQILQTSFTERKFNSLPNTSCKECQNLKKVRGQKHTKDHKDTNVPKEQDKNVSMCSSCNRMFMESRHNGHGENIKTAVHDKFKNLKVKQEE